MAVELLVLAEDGPGDRRAGAIIDVKECPDGKTASWGSKECPPFFRIIHIEGVTKKTLDPKWLEYGWHQSRVTLNIASLPKALQDRLADEKVVSIVKGTVEAIAADRGANWQPVPTESIK